jgi:Protein of unknown function (DUF2971)
MNSPRLLYKYMPRPLFFENAMFRFKQPKDLDLIDPEEAVPGLVLNQHAPEDYAVERLHLAAFGLHSIPSKQLEFLMQPFPSRRFDERSFPGLWPKSERELRNEPFASLKELDEAVAHRAIVECIKFANREAGILSLTQSPRQNTMWVHYANHHQGIVVEIDGTHPYFAKAMTFFPIKYSDRLVSVSLVNGLLRIGGIQFSYKRVLRGEITEIPLQLLLRKKLEWAYEREWRMLQRLGDCDERRDNPDPSCCAICLFRIPKQAIKAVIFGFKADPGWKDSVKTEVLANAD